MKYSKKVSNSLQAMWISSKLNHLLYLLQNLLIYLLQKQSDNRPKLCDSNGGKKISLFEDFVPYQLSFEITDYTVITNNLSIN